MSGFRIKFFVCLTLLMTVYMGQSQAEEIVIQTPTGGWQNSKDERSRFTQTVNYPASSVNVPEDGDSDIPQTALIKGHIAKSLKSPKNEPFKLIVNGIPMPLRIEEDGSFARPYSFGPGSNNVEIRSPDRTAVSRVQFYEAYTGITRSKLRVVLSWDTDATDLDLHVISPDGQHCYYGERVMKNGGALDVDVTTGYGPEIFGTPSPIKGTYLIFLNYYGGPGEYYGDDSNGESNTASDNSDGENTVATEGSGTATPGSSEGENAAESDSKPYEELITVAQVTVISSEGTPDEKVHCVTVPMRAAGEIVSACRFVYP